MSREIMRAHIDTIEAGYEYLLAYAAQGLEANQQGPHLAEVRKHLEAMEIALTEIGAIVRGVARDTDGDNVAYESILAALEEDAERSRAAVNLVLNRPGISSQLVDNLNASIHIRALLTDLFLLDEAFRG